MVTEKSVEKNRCRTLSQSELDRINAIRQRDESDPGWKDDFFLYESTEGEEIAHKVSRILRESLSQRDKKDEFDSRLMSITGQSNPKVAFSMLCRIADTLCDDKNDVKKFTNLLNEVCQSMQAMNPQDAMEGYLCEQIVVCQKKGMEAIKIASREKKFPELMHPLYKVGIKLLARSQSAIQTLNSYRRGGQQKMIVEHINVLPGAKAVVGQFSIDQSHQGDVGNAVNGAHGNE